MAFDALPIELIAHIATCSQNGLTTLRLSRTSRRIRTACYDCLIFRETITNSQAWRWDSAASLDIDAIAVRCAGDVSIWARYAVADQKAWELSQLENPLEFPIRFFDWLPELLVVKHPFVFHECWRHLSRDPVNLTTKEMFCLALAVMACEGPMPGLRQRLHEAGGPNPWASDTSQNYLRGFCLAVIDMKAANRSWLETTLDARVEDAPYSKLPRLDQINMTTALTIPIPFAGRTSSSWYEWFGRFGLESALAHRVFVQNWQGYHLVCEGRSIPYYSLMTNIKFDIQRSSDDPEWPFPNIKWSRWLWRIKMEAGNCCDGIGIFSLNGHLG